MLDAIRRFADRLAETPATFHWLRKLPEANYRETKRRIARIRDEVQAQLSAPFPRSEPKASGEGGAEGAHQFPRSEPKASGESGAEGAHQLARSEPKASGEIHRARVLDLGCGTAEYAELFDPASYLGVDIHPGYIEFARRRRPRHRFVVADVRSWGGEVEPFDLVLINGVLHHLDDAGVQAFLRTAHGLVRPGGTLLVIEDVHLADPPLGTRLVHLLDHGDFIRDAARWQALVSAVTPIARSETYASGVCPYHLMLCPKPAA